MASCSSKEGSSSISSSKRQASERTNQRPLAFVCSLTRARTIVRQDRRTAPHFKCESNARIPFLHAARTITMCTRRAHQRRWGTRGGKQRQPDRPFLWITVCAAAVSTSLQTARPSSDSCWPPRSISGRFEAATALLSALPANTRHAIAMAYRKSREGYHPIALVMSIYLIPYGPFLDGVEAAAFVPVPGSVSPAVCHFSLFPAL